LSHSALYTGPNGNGQTVFTWLAGSNITTFSKDISPLFNYLTQHDLLPNTTYLGIVQFGTETFHSTSNVTFSASDFSMKVVQGEKKSMAIGGVVPNMALILLVGLSGLMALL
jgi:xyloglucan-specific endo-beta-1,4-glucanase